MKDIQFIYRSCLLVVNVVLHAGTLEEVRSPMAPHTTPCAPPAHAAHTQAPWRRCAPPWLLYCLKVLATPTWAC